MYLYIYIYTYAYIYTSIRRESHINKYTSIRREGLVDAHPAGELDVAAAVLTQIAPHASTTHILKHRLQFPYKADVSSEKSWGVSRMSYANTYDVQTWFR